MTVENEGGGAVPGVTPGPLGFDGFDALILCDLINNNEYMNALVNHRAGATEPSLKPGPSNDLAFPLEFEQANGDVYRAGLPTGPGPEWGDVVDFHFNGVAEEAARQAFEGHDFEGLVTFDDIVGFLRKVQASKTQREGLAYLVERFQGTIRNGTSRRILQSLGMFIEYTVKAENADVLAGGDKSAIKPNRLMW